MLRPTFAKGADVFLIIDFHLSASFPGDTDTISMIPLLAAITADHKAIIKWLSADAPQPVRVVLLRP